MQYEYSDKLNTILIHVFANKRCAKTISVMITIQSVSVSVSVSLSVSLSLKFVQVYADSDSSMSSANDCPDVRLRRRMSVAAGGDIMSGLNGSDAVARIPEEVAAPEQISEKEGRRRRRCCCCCCCCCC